jgi:hypothetical protein
MAPKPRIEAMLTMEPPVLLRHALRPLLADAEHPVEIDLHDIAPMLFACFQKERAGRHARIVDQHRDGACHSLRRIEGADDRGPIHDIERHRPGLTPTGADLRFEPLQALYPARRPNNPGSGGGQHARKMLPQSRGSAGYKRRLAGKGKQG